jgi:uncharacterized OB-fold protein
MRKEISSMPEIKCYCPKCGEEVSPTDDFCRNCGTRLTRQDTSFHPLDSNGNNYTYAPKAAPAPTGERDHEYGVVSLILGILSFVLPFLGIGTAIGAIIVGAKFKDKDHTAFAGMIVGIVALVIQILFVIGVIKAAVTAANNPSSSAAAISVAVNAAFPFLGL